MPTMRIVLQVNEQEALQELAIRELRDPRAQAVFIIRRNLAELGLLSVRDDTTMPSQNQNGSESDEGNE